MRKVLLTICLLVGMLMVQGCVTTIQRIPFPAKEYKELPKKNIGTATVRGQAFLKTVIGEVRYAAGNEVDLAPVTSYTTQMYNAWKNFRFNGPLSGPTKFEPEVPDSRVNDYTNRIVADGDGRFEFKNVSAGEYYIITSLVWEIPNSSCLPNLQGGILSEKIIVVEGEEYNIILTR